ncbi:hypothetical protein RND81_13G202600 [Saponaria officinalis]|uniref:Uncharacterized protein n=1 Tax=Saponaria officinalis TaxID=3572 RepID=A0AAW1H3L7_SAPOF
MTDTRQQGQEFCRILVLTEEGKGTTTRVQLGSDLEGPTCVDISDPFPPFVVTVDMEPCRTDVSETNQNTCDNIKTDISSTKPLRRQNSIQIRGESIQPLVNHILMLLKFDAKEKTGLERAYDGANSNRWRKCKRLSLFDSRQIVIAFSVLSSMGTLLLIYLTLRVTQVNHG